MKEGKKMKRNKKILVAVFLGIALISGIRLCGGPGMSHPIIDTIIYNII